MPALSVSRLLGKVARCIWEKAVAAGYSDKSAGANEQQLRLKLSDSYSRLGDLMRFNANPTAALEEYKKSLMLRETVCEKQSDR